MIPVLKKILGLPPVLFARRWVSDSTLGLSREEAELFASLRLAPQGGLYGDRFREFRAFFHVSLARCLVYFCRYGWPFSRRMHDHLERLFNQASSPDRLMDAYRAAAYHYALFHMTSVNRAEWIAPFLDAVAATRPQGFKGLRVLDYGCGVGDIALLLARLGAEVTVVELATANLDFVRWRFRSRNLPLAVIPVTSTESFPDVGRARYDLVVATEILEHVRNPDQLLNLLSAALAPRGLLFSSMGTDFRREVGGDHLPEAADILGSPEFREHFLRDYQLFAERRGLPWLFQRTA